MAAETRLYVVEDSKGDARLIRGVTKSQVIAHAARAEFSVRVASQDDLCELIGKGIKPEAATRPAAIDGPDDEE